MSTEGRVHTKQSIQRTQRIYLEPHTHGVDPSTRGVGEGRRNLVIHPIESEGLVGGIETNPTRGGPGDPVPRLVRHGGGHGGVVLTVVVHVGEVCLWDVRGGGPVPVLIYS